MISVVNNLPALNAQRRLNLVNNALSKSLERLSSGLRINSPGDDPAGLSIANKIQQQLKLLHQSQFNDQNALSLLQTAGGSLNKAVEILNRIKELAAEASDPTKSSQSADIQKEINAQLKELTKIAATTQFNGTKLLDGSIAPVRQAQNVSGSVATNAYLGNAGTALIGGVQIANATAYGSYGDETFRIEVAGYNGANTVHINVYSSAGTAGQVIAQTNMAVSSSVALTFHSRVSGSTHGAITITVDLSGIAAAEIPNIVGENATVSVRAGNSAVTTDNSLHIFAGVVEGEMVTVGLMSIKADDLFNGQEVSVGNYDAAQGVINQVSHALDIVNDNLARVGAAQNRIQKDLENLATYEENLTASKSRITDLDFAKETSTFIKNQFLLQSSTAVLAQANAVPQVVLQLFR